MWSECLNAGFAQSRVLWLLRLTAWYRGGHVHLSTCIWHFSEAESWEPNVLPVPERQGAARDGCSSLQCPVWGRNIAQ